MLRKLYILSVFIRVFLRRLPQNNFSQLVKNKSIDVNECSQLTPKSKKYLLKNYH